MNSNYLHLSIDEFKKEIQHLQFHLPAGMELEWSTNETWIDGECFPNFKVTKKYTFNQFVVNTRVSITIREIDGRHLKISVFTEGDVMEGNTLLEMVESGLDSDKDRKLEFVKGYIVL